MAVSLDRLPVSATDHDNKSQGGDRPNQTNQAVSEVSIGVISSSASTQKAKKNISKAEPKNRRSRRCCMLTTLACAYLGVVALGYVFSNPIINIGKDVLGLNNYKPTPSNSTSNNTSPIYEIEPYNSSSSTESSSSSGSIFSSSTGSDSESSTESSTDSSTALALTSSSTGTVSVIPKPIIEIAVARMYTAITNDFMGPVGGYMGLFTLKRMPEPDNRVLIKSLLKYRFYYPVSGSLHIYNSTTCPIPSGALAPHFNPTNKLHGSSVTGHVGDLGDIFFDTNYKALYLEYNSRINLDEIEGKAIAIRQTPDDQVSQPSGDTSNNPTLIACGIITRHKIY